MSGQSLRKLFLPMIAISWYGLLFNVCLAQQKYFKPAPDSTIYKSSYGYFLPPHGTTKVLIVLAEINYDTGVDSNTWVTWKQGTFPEWGDNFVDVKKVRNGMLSRYYDLASSGDYKFLGDYLSPPSGPVIVVNNSEIKSSGYKQALVNAINRQMTSGFQTRSGIKDPSAFDNWTPTKPGFPKKAESNHAFDHVMIIWRNFTIANGTGNAHPFENLSGKIFGYTTDSWSQFGAQDGMPLDIARHEYSHLLIGGNNFHVGGGREPNMWIGKICAHSMLSLYGAALNCWSAWDRQRLGWKAKKNKYYISARNEKNKKEVQGELDASNADQAGVYTLRDFVTTGDAIRIRLPFIPDTKYHEYIWLEFHEGKSINNIPYDEYKHVSGNSCIPPASAGLFAYLQIGKDQNEEAGGSSVLYGDFSDYVRYISADGFYDETLEKNTVTNSCWPPPIRSFEKQAANPLTGTCDLDDISIDLNSNGKLEYEDRYPPIYENDHGKYLYNVFQAGNARQVFKLNEKKKFGLGYNPSTAAMINMPGENYPSENPKNVRTVYLNGISVEILTQGKKEMQIKIRFDDIDISNDLRWCAPAIELNPIKNETIYSLNIKNGRTVILDQGTSATRMNKPIMFNGDTLFTDPTVLRCLPGAAINLGENSELIVDNNSTLILEEGSRLDLNKDSKLIIRHGGKLIIKKDAQLIKNGGNVEVEPDGIIETE